MADVTTPFGFPYPESTDLVRDGATDIEALAQAANDQFSAGFQFAGQRIYTSSGQFVKADPLGTGDIGLRAIRVRMVGGGGGGGGCQATGAGEASLGGGGGGGGFCDKFITDIAGLSASETVVRGAGGTGGGVAGNGSAGGATTAFGMTAGGGERGRSGDASVSPSDTVDGAGGSASGGDINIVGSGSLSGSANRDPRRVTGSQGGSSMLSNQLRTITGAQSSAAAGLLFGGGANGATQSQSRDALAGAAGGNGVVIVEVFV